MKKKNLLVFGMALGLILALGQVSVAKDKKAIDADVAAALGQLDKENLDAAQLIKDAKGTLICPKLTKVGFGIGVSGGACALMINGETVDYYRSTGASFGLTAGYDARGLALLFNDQATLDEFRKSKKKWDAGASASVSMAKKGAGVGIDTTGLKDAPVVAIPFDEKGLMADASVSGSSFVKIDPRDFDGLLYTFVATADVDDSTNRDTTANLRIAIDRWNTDAERQASIQALRTGGAADMVAQVSQYEPVGRVSQPGDKPIPLLYAYQTELPDGTFKVLLGTTEPMGFGVQRQQAEKMENNVTLIELDLNAKGAGTGVMSMGAEYSFDEKRDMVSIDKVTLAPVRLTSVSAKAN